MLLEREGRVKLKELRGAIVRVETLALLGRSDFVDDGLGGGAGIFRG
jgi:hypothetical protein